MPFCVQFEPAPSSSPSSLPFFLHSVPLSLLPLARPLPPTPNNSLAMVEGPPPPEPLHRWRRSPTARSGNLDSSILPKLLH